MLLIRCCFCEQQTSVPSATQTEVNSPLVVGERLDLSVSLELFIVEQVVRILSRPQLSSGVGFCPMLEGHLNANVCCWVVVNTPPLDSKQCFLQLAFSAHIASEGMSMLCDCPCFKQACQ